MLAREKTKEGVLSLLMEFQKINRPSIPLLLVELEKSKPSGETSNFDGKDDSQKKMKRREIFHYF